MDTVGLRLCVLGPCLIEAQVSVYHCSSVAENVNRSRKKKGLTSEIEPYIFKQTLIPYALTLELGKTFTSAI
jgi:hypothetical protein